MEHWRLKICPLLATSAKGQVGRQKGSVWLAPGKNLLGQFLAHFEVFGNRTVSSGLSAGLSRGGGGTGTASSSLPSRQLPQH